MKNEIDNEGVNSGVIAAEISGSVNVVYNGVQASELMPLLKELTQDYLERYKKDALVEALQRESRLVIELLNLLKLYGLANADALKAFRDPRMQFDYQEAQKGIIIAGIPDLEKLLAEILVKRIQAPFEPLLEIILSEAIKVVSKLLPPHLATLSLSFTIMYNEPSVISNIDSFSSYYKSAIEPLIPLASRNYHDMRHLDFSGCSHSSFAGVDLASTFLRQYPLLFCKGLDKEEIVSDSNRIPLFEKYPEMFRPFPENPAKYQVRPLFRKPAHALFDEFKIEDVDRQRFLGLLNKQKMDSSSIYSKLIKNVPKIQELYDYWEHTEIDHLRLTSVGVVIGAIYAELITGVKYDLKSLVSTPDENTSLLYWP